MQEEQHNRDSVLVFFGLTGLVFIAGSAENFDSQSYENGTEFD